MSIFSMTGYGVASRETAAGTLTIEIKSVNSRFLDLQFRINDELRGIESLLREAIMARVARGKVECRLSFGRKTGAGAQELNESVLTTLAQLQTQIRSRFADAPVLTVNELLRWPGIIQEAELGPETLQLETAQTLELALAAFLDSRAREGTALGEMLLTRIDAMEAIVQRISPLIPEIVTQYQQKAVERMQDALGLSLTDAAAGQAPSRQEIMERIRQEVTLYGIRIDVAEELSRLSAHLSETRRLLKKGGQLGKRLDFMMQELNREANTLGSKAASKELADASMDLKLLIEQMREQVQNLE